MTTLAQETREHYEIEKSLATRLRNASADERRTLYTAVYDELYRRVPYLVAKKAAPEKRRAWVSAQMRDLRPLLRSETRFMEIGPGDCALSLEVAKQVRAVVAVDVATAASRVASPPDNFTLLVSDGSSVPVPAGSIDVAYSCSLMEHVHPDDARRQLAGIYASLAPGGAYVCITPSRLSGPHDISRHFDAVATGLHLKEYTITELASLFRSAGFSKVKHYLRVKGIRLFLPTFPACAWEAVVGILPHSLRRPLTSAFPLSMLLNVKLVGVK